MSPTAPREGMVAWKGSSADPTSAGTLVECCGVRAGEDQPLPSWWRSELSPPGPGSPWGVEAAVPVCGRVQPLWGLSYGRSSLWGFSTSS